MLSIGFSSQPHPRLPRGGTNVIFGSFSSTAEIAALLQALEHDSADLELIRREAAALIFRLLWRRRDNAPLTAWEKLHFEMAIALLPTVWLRLCLMHLNMATEIPDEHAREQLERAQGGELAKLTAEHLLERLKRLAIGE